MGSVTLGPSPLAWHYIKSMSEFLARRDVLNKTSSPISSVISKREKHVELKARVTLPLQHLEVLKKFSL